MFQNLSKAQTILKDNEKFLSNRKKEVMRWSRLADSSELIPVSVALSDKEHFYSPWTGC